MVLLFNYVKLSVNLPEKDRNKIKSLIKKRCIEIDTIIQNYLNNINVTETKMFNKLKRQLGIYKKLALFNKP